VYRNLITSQEDNVEYRIQIKIINDILSCVNEKHRKEMAGGIDPPLFFDGSLNISNRRIKVLFLFQVTGFPGGQENYPCTY
jgi:hypothetical protein